MIEWFEIEEINKGGAARFDFAKLEALNGVYMRQSTTANFTTPDPIPCRICPTAIAPPPFWRSWTRPVPSRA